MRRPDGRALQGLQLAASRDKLCADLGEPKPAVQGLRDRVRRVNVELADYLGEAMYPGHVKKIFVQQRGKALTPGRLGHHDAVNIQEIRVPGSEPPVVDTVVRRPRAEGQEERNDALTINDNSVVDGVCMEMFELLCRKRTEKVNRFRIQREDLGKVSATGRCGSHLSSNHLLYGCCRPEPGVGICT